jgi:alkylated DNA repair dioxygenase AlkB
MGCWEGRQRQGARHIQKLERIIAVIGIDIGKNSFHVVGHNERGAIVLRQERSRGQLEARLPTCRRAWSTWKPASVRMIQPQAQ